MDPVAVVSFDAYLLPFIRENIVTLGLLLPVLKVAAKATPWAIDDEILQIITEFRNRHISGKASAEKKQNKKGQHREISLSDTAEN